MVFKVDVDGSGGSIICREGQSVLLAMTSQGGQCIQVGCRSGGCGVCRVQVLSGHYKTGKMSASQVNAEEQSQGIALACQLYPESDLKIRTIGRLIAILPKSSPSIASSGPVSPMRRRA